MANNPNELTTNDIINNYSDGSIQVGDYLIGQRGLNTNTVAFQYVVSIVGDTSPTLGANLNMNGFNINSVTPTQMGYLASATGTTGTGSLVYATSPSLITPILGTPTSGTLTNCTGLPKASITGLGTGVNTALGLSVTGSGGIALATSPSFTTPVLGTPTSGTLTNCSGLPISGIASLGTGVATALATTVTGSGGIALTTSPTLVTPTLGAASATSLTFTSTSGIIGSNGVSAAATGSVGEIIQSNVTSSAISSNTVTNLTFISLTAGDWLIEGAFTTVPAGSTTTSSMVCQITTSSATLGNFRSEILGFAAPAGVASGMPAPALNISVTVTTSVFLVCFVQYAVSTLTGNGTITARRMR